MPLTELEARLRPIARERIARNILPREVPSQILAGKGSGKKCALCDEPVRADQIEYEVEMTDARYGLKVWRFHIVCQSIWQLECARADYLRKNPQSAT